MPKKTNIGSEQNFLGKAMPTIYLDGVDYPLPSPEVGGRSETFEKEIREWIDLDNVIHERIKGYRLLASYTWSTLTATEINDLINIYNATKITNETKLKFSIFPKHYNVRITNFEHDLSEGRGFRSSARMELQGLSLLSNFPTSDQFITIVPLMMRGAIIRTYADQEQGR